MTHIPPYDVDSDLWQAFKLACSLQGLKVKEGLPKALLEFAEKYKSTQIKIDVKVIKNTKKNLLTFIYEEQIKSLLEEIIRAKKRKAYDWMERKKHDLFKILEKHPCLTPELADEVKTVLNNLT